VTIQSGDVKLLASQVMLDVPEGGGAPTATVINDGDSNAIFPDISERDRAGGRVNTIKVFAAVQTDTVDSYYGPNVILAEPPKDPRVSVTMFLTSNFFDTRASAAARIESYLNKGPEWTGFLYENHIAGQRIIQLFQRPESELVRVGHTIVLVKDEGKETEAIQYVRATSVDTALRKFYDPVRDVDYQAMVVSVNLSDALRYDFPGSPAARSFTRVANASIVRDTVVSDAGTYVGAVPLSVTAHRTDFSVYAESIYTQLVPSAQIETPLVDVRMSGLVGALVRSGDQVELNITSLFTTSQNILVGVGVYPGSLSVSRSGVTVTDASGLLFSAGAQCGIIDYGNGILSLTTNVFGTSGGTHVIRFLPAATPLTVTHSQSVPVTTESRSLSYVVTLLAEPSPQSLSVAYMVSGRWYVLHDTGTGIIEGLSKSYGAGTLTFSTRSVVVTLGALPDVGSVIIFSYSRV